MALLEISLPLLDDRFDRFFQVGPPNAAEVEAGARSFLDSRRFEPDLGWDDDPRAKNFVAGKRFLAQAYGDSFTWSGHDGPSWQELFEQSTGQGILNLGTRAYGLDQAVLKFEKYGSDYPTRIAILGLYREMFRRALAYHPYYYFENHARWGHIYKPIFVRAQGGFELVPPPCTDLPCLRRACLGLDPEVNVVLSEYDYWYRTNRRRPVAGFPRVPKYAQVMPEVLAGFAAQLGVDVYRQTFVDDDALELATYLIRRFVDHAGEIGVVPIVLLMYSSDELALMRDGRRLDQDLLEFLEADRVLHIDVGSQVLERHEDDGFRLLFMPDGHFNRQGDQMVAEVLAQALTELDLLEPSAGSPGPRLDPSGGW